MSASATKSNSDVTLIDPFQLIDWRDRTRPDHLYPKFKLFLENFKKGLQASTPEITHQDTDSTVQQTNSEEEMQTGDQRLNQVMSSTSPTGLDALLQKIMDPHTESEQLDKPKNLSASKRPRNKRKEKHSKSSEKPTYQLPKMHDATAQQGALLPADTEPEPKRRRLDKKESSKHRYHSPKRAPKNLKETKQDQSESIQLRRSSRVPRVTTRYLDSIQAELRDSEDE